MEYRAIEAAIPKGWDLYCKPWEDEGSYTFVWVAILCRPLPREYVVYAGNQKVLQAGLSLGSAEGWQLRGEARQGHDDLLIATMERIKP